MAKDELFKKNNNSKIKKSNEKKLSDNISSDNNNIYSKVNIIINDEVNKILDQVNDKLPTDLLNNDDTRGKIKDKLYNYIQENYNNIFKNYILNAENDLQNKLKNIISINEIKDIAKQTPLKISDLLGNSNNINKNNTTDIEKSIINMYSHLQLYIQKEFKDLENRTNNLLNQKSDFNSIISGENAYSVVKCTFKDNPKKPKTVSDIKFAINILEKDLVNPIYHHQVTTNFIIKDIISKHIGMQIENEIEELKNDIANDGELEIKDSELILEKIKLIDKYTDDDLNNEDSKRYNYLTKNLLDKIDKLTSNNSHNEYDKLSIRESINKIIDSEEIKDKGFNFAVNSLTRILENNKMGYQYIDNMKNARTLIIKEYEDSDTLPDESFKIKLSFYNSDQIKFQQNAYNKQMTEFSKEVDRLWETMNVICEKRLKNKRFNLFHNLKNKISNFIKNILTKIKIIKKTNTLKTNTYNDISFIKPDDSFVEESNKTYVYEKEHLKKKLRYMKDKLQGVFLYNNTSDRIILDERIDFILDRLNDFANEINPYHIQPGLLLDIDISTIKLKKNTLSTISSVTNEFLACISKEFQNNDSKSLNNYVLTKSKTPKPSDAKNKVDHTMSDNSVQQEFQNIVTPNSNGDSDEINVTTMEFQEL
ncbi:MAG: cytoplasmic filament protein CfpA [Spirochaetota bacterium]|nr:cytoplasmic filament protein CfpA [Spirochaetota bacterium]